MVDIKEEEVDIKEGIDPDLLGPAGVVEEAIRAEVEEVVEEEEEEVVAEVEEEEVSQSIGREDPFTFRAALDSKRSLTSELGFPQERAQQSLGKLV